jgi:hypothetical protein
MMVNGVKVKFDAKEMGDKLRVRSSKFSEKQTKAVQAVAQRAATELETEGRANIRAGGNFGSERWQQGLQAKVSYRSRSDIQVRMTHSVFFWRVFEYGAKILGKPLLWIPLSFGQAKTRARDFPGKLFRVNRLGKSPLLMNENGPQYVGKESVTIPRKWRLRNITKKIAGQMGKFYREAMKNG